MSSTTRKYVVLRSMPGNHTEMRSVFCQAVKEMGGSTSWMGSINKDLYHRNSFYSVDYESNKQAHFDVIVKAIRNTTRKYDHSNHSDVIVVGNRSQLRYYGLT